MTTKEWGEICYKHGYDDRDKEIVRCKDCKHAEPRKDMENAYNCLKNPNPRCWTSHPCDYFCADGERKETK